jgi:hypothetical protein
MEQVLIILAIIVYWIFRSAGAQRRRLEESDPHASDRPGEEGPARDLEDAQQRALAALRSWESRRQERMPPTTRERLEHERREAYSAIAGLLDPQVRPGRVPERVEPTGEEGRRAPGRPPSSRPAEPRVPVSRARTAEQSARSRRAAPASSFERIERLPRLRRAILYSEILGSPKALQEEQFPEG